MRLRVQSRKNWNPRSALCGRSLLRACQLRAKAGGPGLRAKAVCSCRPGPPATAPQGGGGAPVLRPTLAGHHHGPQRPAASTRAKRAKSHDTANGGLRPGAPPPPCCNRRWPATCRGATGGAGAGGSGYGRRPHSRCHGLSASLAGVDGAARRGPRRVPRERGPENVPRATCLARTRVRAATQRTAQRKGPNATPILVRSERKSA